MASAASPAKFFEMVRAHTIMGFLAHPKYGGNRDYAGWRVTGYPDGGHHLACRAEDRGRDGVEADPALCRAGALSGAGRCNPCLSG